MEMYTRKSSAKRECRDENVFLKADRALRLVVSPIPVQIVEFRGAPSSYVVLKKFHWLAW